MQETKADVREKLLGNMEPETNNVIEIQAMTAIGWGEGVRKTTTTVPWSGKILKLPAIRIEFLKKQEASSSLSSDRISGFGHGRYKGH